MTGSTTPASAGRTPATVLGRAGASGAAVGLWYALPDYVDRRRSRVLAKLAILAGAGVVFARRQDPDSSPTAPSAVGTTPGRGPGPLDTAGQGQLADETAGTRARLKNLNPGLVIGLGATILIVGIGANIATERWIHRFGERLKANGSSRPHTAIGLIAGSLTALASLDDLPSPRE
ncbi:MAG: hypothetical protein ACTHWW_07900 [Arthrobacter sp.]|uniref:hypothetical protein n=1 Tax=unclassified Arthrobacter TaxID=235627 RepID=UPI0026529CBC|nr:hypothetical protein [Micrococcaceae bacterium]MDN5814012.1 hypothetical protein [Micrococcaceae bacterium]MDN5823333.1 hypothetical protein [Micrococcaceae bacterium]MDN5879997.1 hypothetical protein [Micrococcaceae bacterium]MDN5886467.1 hypothetical protein [Micrococcaceae bacterium]